MVRRITIKGDDSTASPVEFELDGSLFRSVSSIPLRSMLIVAETIEIAGSDEGEADADQGMAAFTLQYELLLSLLAPESRTLFESKVESGDLSISISQMTNLIQTLMEELSGNEAAGPGESSDTTSSIDTASTDSSQPTQAGRLVTWDQMNLST